MRGSTCSSAHFPAGANTPTTVIVPERDKVEAVRSALQDDPAVASVGEPVNGPPGTRLDVQLKLDPYSTEAFDQIPQLRQTVKRAGGQDVLVGGETAAAYDVRKSSTRDNYVIMPITLVVVFAILALLLRSLVAPAVLVATVILSFGAAMGTGMFFSETVFGFPGIDPSLPLLCFVFLVALGIDYNIFLMARVREETAPARDARGHAARARGHRRGHHVGRHRARRHVRALAVLPLVFLTEIGFIVAFGVLLDTFIVRSILVPALTFIIDRRIWWPSKLR